MPLKLALINVFLTIWVVVLVLYVATVLQPLKYLKG